ncbi:hypothetical protein F4703DRAFT_1795609 [Phycomyces blakesleeanus]
MYRYNGLAVILFSMGMFCNHLVQSVFKIILELWIPLIQALHALIGLSYIYLDRQDSSTHRNTSMTAKIHRKESQRYRLVRLSDILKINDSVIGVNELLYFD